MSGKPSTIQEIQSTIKEMYGREASTSYLVYSIRQGPYSAILYVANIPFCWQPKEVIQGKFKRNIFLQMWNAQQVEVTKRTDTTAGHQRGNSSCQQATYKNYTTKASASIIKQDLKSNSSLASSQSNTGNITKVDASWTPGKFSVETGPTDAGWPRRGSW